MIPIGGGSANKRLVRVRPVVATVFAVVGVALPSFAPAAAGSPAPSTIASARPSAPSGASLALANSELFSDPAGDVLCCTLDLLQVRVSNTDAGAITFDAAFNDDYGPTEPRGSASDLFLLLDADRNPATGLREDGYGFEYQLSVQPDGATLSHWSKRTSEFRYRARAGGTVSPYGNIRFSVDRHQLGDTNGFAFELEAWMVAQGNATGDSAPDRPGFFPVKIALSRLRPSLRVSPAQPRPGGPLSASLALRVEGTKQFLASGRVLCVASIGARRLTGNPGAFVGRRARCFWHVPLRSKGKIVSGSVAVAVAPKALVSRRFTMRVG
jgi:hypothetical protein